jgi:hypothetical protein
MHCVITTKSMLEVVAISRFLKVFHYSEYKDVSTHINGFKMKQSSPKGFGFSKVSINIYLYFFFFMTGGIGNWVGLVLA